MKTHIKQLILGLIISFSFFSFIQNDLAISKPYYQIYLETPTSSTRVNLSYDQYNFDQVKATLTSKTTSNSTNVYTIKRFKDNQQKTVYARYGIVYFEQISEIVNIYDSPNNDATITSYINKSTQQDAAYIDTTIINDIAWFKIKISGLTGWVKEDAFDNLNASNQVKSSALAGIIPYSKLAKQTVYGSTGYLVSRYQTINNRFSMMSLNKNSYVYPGYTLKPRGEFNNVTYSYDGIYYYNSLYYLLKDLKTTSFTNSINVNYPYYDYYQYLPVRSYSRLNATHLEGFLKNYRPESYNWFSETKTFKDCSGRVVLNNHTYSGTKSVLASKSYLIYNAANYYGLNPSAIFALTMLESDFGSSDYSHHYNNLWGFKAYDNCPNLAMQYPSLQAGIDDVMLNLYSLKYLDTNWFGVNGLQPGNKRSGMNYKYAGDPNWGYKLAKHYRYMDELYGKLDYNLYAIGITLSKNVVVYDQTLTSPLYTFINPNSSVIITKIYDDKYQIVSSQTFDKKFNYGEYGYIKKSDLKRINWPTPIDPMTVKCSLDKVCSYQDNNKLYGSNQFKQIINNDQGYISHDKQIIPNLPNGQQVKKIIIQPSSIIIQSTSNNLYSAGSSRYGYLGLSKTQTNGFEQIKLASGETVKDIIFKDGQIKISINEASNVFYYFGKNTPAKNSVMFNAINIEPIRVVVSNNLPVQINYYHDGQLTAQTNIGYLDQKIVSKTYLTYLNGQINQKQESTYNGLSTKFIQTNYINQKISQVIQKNYWNNHLTMDSIKKYTNGLPVTKVVKNYQASLLVSRYEYFYSQGKLSYMYKTLYSNNKAYITYKATYLDGVKSAYYKVTLRS